MLRISQDLDGCLCNFWNPYLEKFGIPKDDKEITKNVVRKLRNDKDFWLNLPKIREINYIPHQYTTARTINKQWIREYLDKEGFPKAPIYQVFGYSLSKANHIKKGGADVHVDDSISVFIDLNLKGIPCLLLDAPNNRTWGPIGRIYNLDIEEIEDTYYLLKDTVLPYFKEILNDFREH